MASHEKRHGFPPELTGMESVSLAFETPATKRAKRSSSTITRSNSGLGFTPDGRACTLCGAKDSDSDVICPDELTWWAYPPKNGKSNGNHCGYCLKAYEGRYRHKESVGGMSALALRCGRDGAEMEKFKGFRSECISRMQAAGTREVRIAWADIDQQQSLDYVQEKMRQRVYDAPWFDVQTYMDQHGDPLTNGRGDSYYKLDGKVGVKMKEQVTLRRIAGDRAKLTTNIDDGKMLFGKNQMEEKFQDIANQFFDNSTAFSLAEVLVPKGAAASSTTSPKKPAQSTLEVEEGPSVFKFGDLFNEDCGVVSKEDTCAEKQASGKAKAKGKAKAAAKASSSGSADVMKQSGARGRPPRDLHATAQKFIVEFQSSTQQAAMFAADASGKAQRKWISRLKSDIDKHVDDAKSPDMLQEKKQIYGILEILKLMDKIGIRSPRFVAQYDEVSFFLGRDPAVELECPPFIAKALHEYRCEVAGDPHTFWTLVQSTPLNIAGDSMEAQVIAGKMVVLLQKEFPAAKDAMQLFFKKSCVEGVALRESNLPAVLQVCELVDLAANQGLSDGTCGEKEKLLTMAQSSTAHEILAALSHTPQGQYCAEYVNLCCRP